MITRVYLHDEIKAILIENGNGWMTASKIAQRVKEREFIRRRKSKDAQCRTVSSSSSGKEKTPDV